MCSGTKLLIFLSVIGGVAVAFVGMVYLVFEAFILADFTRSPKSSSPANHITRTVTGAQIGLIVLAVVITRSSSLSLQTKQGLPLGNQIMGWVVLSKCRLTRDVFFCLSTMLTAVKSHRF
jgi:phosphatidylinositol glycan class N